MPKATFLNLPAGKRERFVEAALDEFAREPYDRASVSAIVARLGIAKGSVYQYFDDKLDLFTWLVEEAGRRKLAALEHAVVADAPFFEMLRTSYVAGLSFWRSDPRWARIALRMAEPSQDERLEALRRKHADAAHRWLRERLHEARDGGALRADVSLDDAAHLVHALLSDGVLRAWLARAGLDLAGLAERPALAEVLGEVDLRAVVDEALALLERGLRAPRGRRR